MPYDTAAVPELKPGISYRYLPDGSSPKPLGSANTFSSSCPFSCEAVTQAYDEYQYDDTSAVSTTASGSSGLPLGGASGKVGVMTS